MQLLPHSFDYMVLVYGILAAFLSLFINYTLQPGEIFSGYTIFLSKRKLKRMGNWNQYAKMLSDTHTERKEFDMDVRKLMYQAAEPYFTWEKMVGMCVLCTGFWVSCLSGIFYRFTPVPIIEIVLISHVSIRILTKLL